MAIEKIINMYAYQEENKPEREGDSGSTMEFVCNRTVASQPIFYKLPSTKFFDKRKPEFLGSGHPSNKNIRMEHILSKSLNLDKKNSENSKGLLPKDKFANVNDINEKPPVGTGGYYRSDSEKSAKMECDNPILANAPNSYNRNFGVSMSKENYIILNRGEDTQWLRSNYPNAFLLLSLIAERARRTSFDLDGFLVGDAIIDPEGAGLSRKKYRNAIEKLEELKLIKIVWNGKQFKNDQKRAFKRAIKSTVVNLIDSKIWDINPKIEGHEKGQEGANKGPSKGHKQERRRMKKNEEEIDRQDTTPTDRPDESSSSFFECLEKVDIPDHKKEEISKKFSETRVLLAVRFIEHPNFVAKKDVLSTIYWHLKEPNPPFHPEKCKSQWEIEARKHNEIYKELKPRAFEKNSELINNQEMRIWIDGRFVPISLKNPLEILRKDFMQAEIEYNSFFEKANEN